MKRTRTLFFSFFIVLSSLISVQAQFQIDLISSTPTTCGTSSDGTVSVDVSGGTGTHIFNIQTLLGPVASSGVVNQSSYTFTGLSQYLFYIIVVQDGDPAVGFKTGGASVTGPSTILITSSTSTDITCNGLDDGTISVTASGESGSYIYSLSGAGDPSNETGIFTGLPEGNSYVVTVQDKFGCPGTSSTPLLTIVDPSPVSLTQDNVTNVICFGDNTGSISISANGGTGPYTYSWTGPGGFTSNFQDVTNLVAGDYSVTVFDGNMCSSNMGPIPVTQPTELAATLTSTTDVTCNGGNDGTAAMTPGGGTGGYSFSWDGQFTGLISTAQNPTNLLADTYDFTLFDNSGCSRTFNDFAIIDEPEPFSINVTGTFDVSCPGGTDGSATIIPSGGTAPYTFLWTGATSGYSSTAQNPLNMPADDYRLTITDATGICNQAFPALLTINQPVPISVTVNGTGEVSCFGGADGSADVTVTGGTPVYTLLWTGIGTGHSSTGELPNDLVADTYNLSITDNNGCVQVFNSLLTIDQPDDLAVTVDNITNVNCNGALTGAIQITPSGGTPLFSFSWSGPGSFTANTQNISNLEAGDYSLTITDSRGCFKDFINVATVGTSTPITAIFLPADISCNGVPNGSINTAVSGGTPNYVFNWTGPSGFTANTESISGLLAGSYTLTVTDNLGCIEVMPDQVLAEPTPVTATAIAVDIDCFGDADGSVDLTPGGGVSPYTFAWTGPGGFTASTEDISGLDPGTYSVTVTDLNSCAVLFSNIATVTESPEILVTPVKSDISCGGQTDGSITITVIGGVLLYSFDWSGPGGFTSSSQDLTGLGAGTYDLTITGGNGCIVNFPGVETIIEPAIITANYVSQVDVLCNGDATGSIEIDVTGGVVPLGFIWTDGSGATISTDEDPTGLHAETYSLLISDASGCSVTFPDMATISEPLPITVSLAKTDMVCYGDNDGTITVTASGGTGSLEYSRTGDIGPAYQPGNVFTGLGPGFYTIWTRDASLCVVTDTISIIEPLEIQILGETKAGQNLCFGDASGSITIDEVTGGVLPYEYSINNGVDFSPSNVFLNLPAGNYQTVVRDQTGCEASGNLNLITQPTRVRIDSYFQEDITTCFDALEGRIVISGAGGFGAKTYTLNDTLPSITGDFQNLPAGTHVVIVEDQNGCNLDTTVVILSPPEITVDNITITDVTGCAGDANGAVSVTGSGGNGTINYAVDGGAFQVSGSFSGLIAGVHTISIRDDNNCIIDSVITISEPAPIGITSELVTTITCAGASNGIIHIQATGGTPPLNYTLNPGGISDPGGLFSGLAPGTYTVDVGDSEGCSPVTSLPITLTDPPPFVLDSVQDENISCNGAANGTISIYASGGIYPYEYSYDNMTNWGPDSMAVSLAQGTYEVYVRDANLCLISGGSFTMTDPPALALTINSTDITTCSGDTIGAIEAIGSGGSGLLAYSLNGIDFQDSGIYINLAAGSYTVYLRDEGNCSFTEPVSINEPAPVLATITKTDATFGNLGTITITESTGGTSPYQYTIDGPSGAFTSDTAYTLLEAGTYHVIVMDMNACSYEETIIIRDVLPLYVIVNASDVTCFGANDGTIEFIPQDAEGAVEFSINNGVTFVAEALFENLASNTTYYLVAIDAIGKVFNDSVTITEPTNIAVTWIATPAECNTFSETGAIDITATGGSGGYTYQWSDGITGEDRSNIVAGEYILLTTDANSCNRIDTIVVSSQVIVDAYAGRDTTICQGTSVQFDGLGGHTPSWSPVDFLSDPDISNPMAIGVTQTTTYVLTISEEASSFGCFNTDTVTISVHPLTGIEVSQDTFIVRGTSVQIEAIGGPFGTYRWEPATGLDNNTIPNPVASPVESTMYTVYATNELECEEADSLFIEVIEDIRAYNVFTPNGDGYNDYFDIENAQRFPEIVVEVFSRWGDLYFSTVGYDDGSRWDGTARGKKVPLGTYYYVIIPYNGARPITGNVTIIR